MEKNTMDHMEELKQQFAILTDKLESQEINNERLLRTVMKTKMKSINKYYYWALFLGCLLYTSPSPRDRTRSRMPSSA